ncbi:MAG: NrsF family protein, partial [Kofleriaceae bacterium]|nr:NrsF family protein [Kofleriaceae bacterium]
LEDALDELEPVNPRRPLRQLAVLLAISLMYGAGVLAVVATRLDMHELSTLWIAGAALAWLVGFVVPVYLALVPRRGSMLGRWELAAASAVLTSIAFVSLGLTVHPSGPSSLYFGSEQFLRGHVCLELGLATALVPVVIGMLCLRGALPVGSRWIAAALGAGSGSLGGLVLHLHCRVTDGLHQGLIHGGVVVVAALLAAALAPRMTEPR